MDREIKEVTDTVIEIVNLSAKQHFNAEVTLDFDYGYRLGVMNTLKNTIQNMDVLEAMEYLLKLKNELEADVLR